VKNANTYNVRIESKVYVGETFWRYSEALGLFVCVVSEGGRLKNDCKTYLKYFWRGVKPLTNVEHSDGGELLA